MEKGSKDEKICGINEIEENILYEDKEILVCRKTAGNAGAGSKKIETMDMESALKNYRHKNTGKIPYLGSSTRLDQPVDRHSCI